MAGFYKICKGDGFNPLRNLENEVQECLNEGYELVGGVSNSGGILVQAVILKETPGKSYFLPPGKTNPC